MTAAWAVALALLDGAHGIIGSVTQKNEYLLDIARVGDPLEFLGEFTEPPRRVPDPCPGPSAGIPAVPVLARPSSVSPQPSVVASLEIAVGALAVPAVLVTVREVAGEARRAAGGPFVAVAPVAIWIASSADALYGGVGACAVMLVVLATGRNGRRADVLALGGGLLFGALALLSYGLVLLAVIPIMLALCRADFACSRSRRSGGASCSLAFALAGFWWFAGLAATRARYHAGVARAGPSTAFLLVERGVPRDRARTRARGRARPAARSANVVLVGGALVAIGIAAVSGMSKGEVERIWLPFALWVLPAGARVVGRVDRRRAGWRTQVVFTIGAADPGAKPVVILVTGGAGFIGSFVVEQLCDLGHEVRVLDRLHPGAHDGVARRPRPASRVVLG